MSRLSSYGALQARTAGQFGVEVDNVRVNFGRVMERMRELRAKMSANDSAKRFASMGVDVYQVALDGNCMDCMIAPLAKLGSDLLYHCSIE